MTEPSTRPCPTCAGTSVLYLTTTDRNRGVSDRLFHYYRCDECRLVFLADPPEDLGRYYEDDYYARPNESDLERLARKQRFQIDLLLEHAKPGRLVEIGPRWGVFSRAAQAAGFDVSAIEMDASCCDSLRAAGIDAHNSDKPAEVLGELSPSRVIAMWHVMEHLVDPWVVLDAASDNLEPEGVLVVATPNPSSLGLRLMGGRWPHVDAPRHLWLVPAPLLRRRLEDRGLTLEAISARNPTSRSLGRSAWRGLLSPREAGPIRRGVALPASLALWGAFALPEMVDLAGSEYTAVFRKTAPR